ncbi:hypothetical protein JTE90_001038 [Oedothorax gibbosus]|uniref:RING-type E3 ubiquitin transferase n=1 Tax=Oedothorax gibbosus TaxID=931172 RepID=A0AAV6TJW0_9ARAC|nr:hypothetical protein JTE90_001038 [Oedothorax gibbosus]
MAETLESKYFCHYCTREFKLTDELVCPGCSSDFLEILSKEFYDVENLPCDESSDHETDSDGLLIPNSVWKDFSVKCFKCCRNLPPSVDSDVVPPEGPSMFAQTFQQYCHECWFKDLSTADGFLRNFNWNTAEEIDALAFELLDEMNVSAHHPCPKTK